MTMNLIFHIVSRHNYLQNYFPKPIVKLTIEHVTQVTVEVRRDFRFQPLVGSLMDCNAKDPATNAWSACSIE